MGLLLNNLIFPENWISLFVAKIERIIIEVNKYKTINQRKQQDHWDNSSCSYITRNNSTADSKPLCIWPVSM